MIVVSLANLAQLPVHDVDSTLVFATNAHDVRVTIVGGEEIMRDGESGRVDLREIRNEFDLLAARMT
jgi:5-methylthioadenosine/S-adenosylhomocysteine deaminase